MGIYHNRPTVADIRAMKARGQTISMLYVTTLEEAAAAAAAGINMLSIEGRFFSPEMREAAGDCFIQVGLPYGPFGDLVTTEDYLRAAFHFMEMGATASIMRPRSISRKRCVITLCRLSPISG
jgi:3-methyl-2-oxobutanoate hydroxymethyltransferase